ncbi:MAG: GAF and ANTAR domain-containing protein [Brooklawnia sp.]|uniref:GAF and ANTAR domain-containing protein n=1 Tax=Brooklawnia sp. TaxID=2699740 RepID=UPI003C72D823
MEATWSRLVDLAIGAIPGCDWAALTFWSTNREPRSLATSGGIASEVDQLQFTSGEGPCLAAAESVEVVHMADVATDWRWPMFSEAVLAHTPVRSVLSLHLGEHPERAALNLYAAQPGAFDVEAVDTAALFATHARALLSHAASASKAVDLVTALASSRVIGAAIGILMNSRKVTSDDAFTMLRQSSQRLNRKLREIAHVVTETGALPAE